MKPLLKLAREAIKSSLDRKNLEVDKDTIKKYSEKGACFVTLTENGELRGCIGSLETRQELYKDIIENALNASFNDYRFMPLRKEELDKIKIEISVLTKPQKLEYKDENDLLKKLSPDMGIILAKNMRSATFLPQVWDQLPDKIEFLEHLSTKAGLKKDDWKDAEYEYYTVEKIKEN
jgi:AmmeMemoRadiSam system protein A